MERARGCEGDVPRPSNTPSLTCTPSHRPKSTSNGTVRETESTESLFEQETVPVIRIPASSVIVSHPLSNPTPEAQIEPSDRVVAERTPQRPTPKTYSFKVLPSSRTYLLPNYPTNEGEHASSEPQTPATTPNPSFKSAGETILIDSPSPPRQGQITQPQAATKRYTVGIVPADVRSAERPRRSATNSAKLSKAIKGVLMESDVEDEY